jgi:hypothetical protein
MRRFDWCKHRASEANAGKGFEKSKVHGKAMALMHAYVASQVSFWTLALLAGLVLVVTWGMKR